MKMKKEDREIFLKQIFWEVVGSAFIAGGIYNFAVQAGFPMTGFSGISIILYQLFGVPIGFSTILLNIPVAILTASVHSRLLSSAGKTLFLQLTALYADFFPDD